MVCVLTPDSYPHAVGSSPNSGEQMVDSTMTRQLEFKACLGWGG